MTASLPRDLPAAGPICAPADHRAELDLNRTATSAATREQRDLVVDLALRLLRTCDRCGLPRWAWRTS